MFLLMHAQMKYMMKEHCILVDEMDKAIGSATKLQCHQFIDQSNDKEPIPAAMLPLHRAFSLFLFSNNPQGRMLIQKRAAGKLTFPGLWTNACCSHPLWLQKNNCQEPIKSAVVRKVAHELGIGLRQDELNPIGKIIYSAASGPQYGEHERMGKACIKLFIMIISRSPGAGTHK